MVPKLVHVSDAVRMCGGWRVFLADPAVPVPGALAAAHHGDARPAAVQPGQGSAPAPPAPGRGEGGGGGADC